MEKDRQRIFGYARVSSKEQNLDRQILALKEYVPEENILVDKASGKDLGKSFLPGVERSFRIKTWRYADHYVIRPIIEKQSGH